jgi:hypothetical protein
LERVGEDRLSATIIAAGVLLAGLIQRIGGPKAAKAATDLCMPDIGLAAGWPNAPLLGVRFTDEQLGNHLGRCLERVINAREVGRTRLPVSARLPTLLR